MEDEEEKAARKAKGKELRRIFVCGREHSSFSCDLTQCGFALSPFIIEIHFSFYAFLNPTWGGKLLFRRIIKVLIFSFFFLKNQTHPNTGKA